MAVAFQVTDLQERIRVRCALPVFTTDTNISTADILTLVQESARSLSGELDNADWYFATTQQLTTVPQVAVASLPVNFASLLQLHWDRGDGYPVQLNQANLEDVQPSPANPVGWDSCVPRYRLTGNTVEFFPTPQAAFDVLCRYTTGIFLTDATDTLFGQVSWDEWIVYDCCCKVRQSQEKDYAAFAGERQAAMDKIMKAARKRNRQGVTQPRDVRGALRGEGPLSRTDWRKL